VAHTSLILVEKCDQESGPKAKERKAMCHSGRHLSHFGALHFRPIFIMYFDFGALSLPPNINTHTSQSPANHRIFSKSITTTTISSS